MFRRYEFSAIWSNFFLKQYIDYACHHSILKEDLKWLCIDCSSLSYFLYYMSSFNFILQLFRIFMNVCRTVLVQTRSQKHFEPYWLSRPQSLFRFSSQNNFHLLHPTFSLIPLVYVRRNMLLKYEISTYSAYIFAYVTYLDLHWIQQFFSLLAKMFLHL